MRVTDHQQINALLAAVRNIDVNMLKVQESLSSGKKVNRPSDNASAFEQIANLRNVLQKTEKRLLSLNVGANQLNLTEAALFSTQDVLQRAKELALQGRNDTASSIDRKAIAKEIQQLLLSLVDDGNTQIDSKYVFSGFETQTPAFALGTVSASGLPPTLQTNENNQGTTTAAVSVQTAGSLTGQQYKILFTDATTFDVLNVTSGATVLSGQTYSSGGNIDFDGLRVVITDNPGGPLAGDEFIIDPHNASDATVSASITTPALLQPHLYEIRFTSATTFDLVNLTTDQLLSSGNAYASGGNIVFGGITTVVTDGTVSPQAGDVFRVRPGYSYQGDTGSIAIEVGDGKTVGINSVGSQVFTGPDLNVFTVLQDLHQALVTNTPANLDTVLSQLDTAQEQIINARTDLGARANRLERFREGLELLAVNTQGNRSDLEDADLAKAASDLATLETKLQATLLTLTRQFEISLLNFLR